MILAMPVIPAFVTSIVNVVPTFSAFLRYALSATVPPFVLTIVTDFLGHVPLHVTFTVAPAGTPLTDRLENVVDFCLALMKYGTVIVIAGLAVGITGVTVGAGVGTTVGTTTGVFASAPSQFSSTPLSGTSVTPGLISALSSSQSGDGPL